MRICFYCLGKGCPVPVQNYLESKFGRNYDQPNKEKAQNELSTIVAKWNHAVETDGIPDGHIIKKLSGYDFIEIRVKRSFILIRFPFYRDCQNDRIVLLSGFEKKDGYKKDGKTDREAARKLDEAQEYYNNYQKNNNCYIELPKIFNL